LQFAGSAGGDIDTFLYLTSAGTRAELYGKNSEGVSILTIHAAKGLEFETVFIPGCEDGIIPFTLLDNRNTDLDEERRLLYVGMTRASEHLIVTHARSRMLYGRRIRLPRSPFLEDIDRSLLSLTNSTYTRKKSCVDDKQLGLF
jgi:superfamily I DNA/RNA helicase